MSGKLGIFKVDHKQVGYKRVGVKRGKETNKNKSPERPEMSQEELREDPEIVLKYRNSLTFVRNQELGLTAGIQAKKEFYQIKTSQKEKASSSNLSIPFSYDSCEVDFITGDDQSIYGVWCLSDEQGKINYITGEISYNENNERYEPCNNITRVTDICRGSSEFITVSSEYVVDTILMFNSKLYFRGKEHPPPWYCCCYLSTSDLAAFGGNGYIFFMNRMENYCVYDKYPAKVCTISTHLPSYQLLVGLETGVFWINCPDDSYSVKISDEAVNDSIFLNEEAVIVTDIKGKLVKVDLRTKEISAIFLGHKHSVSKRPFSVANDMLCATGSDNVVRIWHISGGHPIHVQKSTSGHEVRAWLHGDGSKTYLYFFERNTRTVFTI